MMTWISIIISIISYISNYDNYNSNTPFHWQAVLLKLFSLSFYHIILQMLNSCFMRSLCTVRTHFWRSWELLFLVPSLPIWTNHGLWRPTFNFFKCLCNYGNGISHTEGKPALSSGESKEMKLASFYLNAWLVAI